MVAVKKMKIFLIRHGQTTSDIEERYGGDYDDHLTETGRKQAENLANKLINSGIEKIFCSSRIRTKETAKILNQRLSCKIEIVDDFRERNRFGIYTGMKISEVTKEFPDLPKILKDYHTNVEGGEPYLNFEKRVKDSFSEILKLRCKIIAVVTHAGPIKVIFREILKADTPKIDDCGFAELESINNQFKIIKLDGVIFEK